MENKLNSNTTDSQHEKIKTAWNTPTISYIDIKRTMAGTGSIVDFANGPSLT